MHPRRSENQSFWLEETNKAKSVEGSIESLTGSGFALKTKKNPSGTHSSIQWAEHYYRV